MKATHATPGAAKLLDHLMVTHELKNDAALGRALGLAAPVISKLRSGKLAMGPAHMLRVHDKYEMPFRAMRELLAPGAA